MKVITKIAIVGTTIAEADEGAKKHQQNWQRLVIRVYLSSAGSWIGMEK